MPSEHSGEQEAVGEQSAEELHTEIRARAMDLLARREHAPVELAGKLQQRGYDSDAVADVLTVLIRDDLLSSERYAEAVVLNRSRRGIGPLRIRSELARMQIDDGMIKAALDAAETDWFELAAAVCRKRFGDSAPEDHKECSRRMRFLQQRGFDFDCIRAAVDSE